MEQSLWPEAAPLSTGEVGLLIPDGTTVPEQSLPPTCHARHNWLVPVVPLPGKLSLMLRTAPCRVTLRHPTRFWHSPGGGWPLWLTPLHSGDLAAFLL